MRHLNLLLLLLCTLAATAQNPSILKTVTGAPLEPSSDYLLNHRVTPWNGKIFYQGKGSGTQCNLVVTDGTAAGTRLVKDLANGAGINGVYPARDFVYLATIKSEIVSFPPLVVNYVRQLWRTDGTEAGTVLIKTFDATNSTSNTGIFYSDALSSVNYSIDGNTMYFNGYDAANGPELWKTDGTVGGTAMVKDIWTGTSGGNPFAFCKVGNTTLFFARNQALNYQLWQTDGTAAGTQQLVAINPSAQSIAEFNCGLYKGKMYFWANDGATGAEVWYSDGTAAGTKLLKDIIPGNNAFTGSGGARTDLNFIQDDNYLYFPIERYKSVWRTDGTTDGTVELYGGMTSQNIAGAWAKGSKLYWLEQLTTTNAKLYQSNGTPSGTSFVRDNLVLGGQLVTYKGAAWFAARWADFSDVEPWRSDGTAANTKKVFDLWPSSGSSDPYGYFELGGKLYFFARNISGTHLFQHTNDFTFNNAVAGSLWTDSLNWNSFITPGISDTVYIPSGATVNVNGAKAFAGTLIMQGGSTVNLAAAADSLFIHKELKGTAVTGNGIVVLKNFEGGTARISSALTVPNMNVQGLVSNEAGLTVTSNLNLTGSARLMMNGYDITLSGTSSTIGADASNYIVTNGSGSLRIENIGAGGRGGSVVFPVGTSTHYNPVNFSNSGVQDVFSARVTQGINNTYTGETPGGSPYTSNAVNATWFINEGTPGGSNATVGLQWTGTQELPGFDRTQSRLGHFTGGNWQLGAPGNAGGTDPYSWSDAGITSFSPFGVLNGNIILPVHQLQLSVIKTASGNNCRWQIAGENLQSVTLERSENGRSFIPVHTASFSLQGSFEDVLTAPKLYYRLKVQDASGTVKYSNIVWISRNDRNTVLIYPTVFQQSITVQNNHGEAVTLRIFNASGVMLLQQRLQNGTNTIEATSLPSSAYFYQVESNGKPVASGRLVKL
jgi:ELWxxDGT repeat protein